MIQKLHLTSAISKYYLNGMNEAVIWEIKDNTLNVKFNAPSKEMLGSVMFRNVPLEDSKIGISNTTQLNKLLHITNGTLELSYIKNKNIPYKLIVADRSFTLNYTIADAMIIPKPGNIIGDINFSIKAPLDSESINSIVKAKTAVTESETVVIKPSSNEDGEYMIEMEFGGNVEYANKVSYYIQNITPSEIDFELTYNSNLLKEILVNNKDMENGTLHVNNNGLMKIMFNGKNIQSIYYIVAKEN